MHYVSQVLFCITWGVMLVLLPAPIVGRPARPAPSIITSSNGLYYLKLQPSATDRLNAAKCRVVVRRAGYEDEDEIVWSASGWYSANAFLSNDGVHLVRIIGTGDLPTPEVNTFGQPTPALVFMRSGELIAQVTYEDIERECAQLRTKSGHSCGSSGWAGPPDANGVVNTFHFRQAPLGCIVFDARTGESLWTSRETK